MNTNFPTLQALEASILDDLRIRCLKVEFLTIPRNSRSAIAVYVDEVHTGKWWTVSLGRGEEIDVTVFRKAALLTHGFLSELLPENVCYPRTREMTSSMESRLVHTDDYYVCWLAVPPNTAKDFNAFYPSARPK